MYFKAVREIHSRTAFFVAVRNYIPVNYAGG